MEPVEISIHTHYGNYVWCYNLGSYYLSKEGYQEDGFKTFLTIDINMKDDLFKNIDHIEIFSNTHGVIQYSLGITQHYQFRFPINDELINTEVEFIFSKFRKDLQSSPFSTTPLDIIYKSTKIIPPIIILGDLENCSICLEKVNKLETKYITECHHIFHLECAMDYLDKNNKLFMKQPHCNRLCTHSKLFNSFSCPVCRKIIEKKFLENFNFLL